MSYVGSVGNCIVAHVSGAGTRAAAASDRRRPTQDNAFIARDRVGPNAAGRERRHGGGQHPSRIRVERVATP